MPKRALGRLTLAALASGGLALVMPLSASAHVTVQPDADTAGSFAKLTFRVPNESDTAGTVGLRVELPTDDPFPFVSVQPHAGWTAEITRETLPEPVDVGDFTLDEVVSAITWTPDDGVRIGPGEFDEFAISVGPLPEPGDYALPAEQTYDDGEVVAWAGGADDEHPAPLLTVVDADPTDEASSGTRPDDGLARGLAVGGLAAGIVGLGVGALSLRRSRA